MLRQLCDDAGNSFLIENNRVTADWGCNPFSSDTVVFNENSEVTSEYGCNPSLSDPIVFKQNSITSVIADLSQR